MFTVGNKILLKFVGLDQIYCINCAGNDNEIYMDDGEILENLKLN